MNPSYFVRAERNATKVFLPVHDVPELDKPVKQSAINIANHLRNFGWRNVKVIPA